MNVFLLDVKGGGEVSRRKCIPKQHNAVKILVTCTACVMELDFHFVDGRREC